VNTSDPRVKRTRQLLKDALWDLMGEKSFSAISVHDIAARATVNRATFYAHFRDKYELLNGVIRDEFARRLGAALPASAPLTEENLRLLCRTAIASVASAHRRCTPIHIPSGPLVETAIQEALYDFILDWLERQEPAGPSHPSGVAVATAVSWAIFGAGVQWSRGASAPSADELAGAIVAVLLPGLVSLGRAASADGRRRR
jgi:AcrR family transcriptional regulator